MITSFRAKGYKILKDVEIPLRKLTVLVGPNGSGKSSVLEGLEWLEIALSGELHSNADVRRLGRLATRPDESRITLQLEHDSLLEACGLAIDVARTNIELGFYQGLGRFSVEGASHEPFSSLLSPLVRLRFNYENLVAATPGATGEPALSSDGSGLATLVSYLANRRDGSLENIERDVRLVVPAFRRLDTEPTSVDQWNTKHRTKINWNQELNPVPGHRLVVTMAGVGAIPVEEVSEGTVFVIGLLSFLHLKSAKVVLLDDVDRGLHPKAQLELVQLLRAITELPDGPQIIATAHSPMLLAGLREGEIVRLDLDDERGTIAVEEPSGPPGWMTINEILSHFFGVERPALGPRIQRYALLAGDPHRSEEDDLELDELRKFLADEGLDTGFEPVERAGS